MKRKITSILIMTFLLFFTFSLFLFPEDIVKSVILSIIIWKENVFPALFPFFMVSTLLINYGFIDLLGELTKNIMNKLFYLPGESSFVLIGSMLSGFPSSSKYVKDLYLKKLISKNEASYLLCFTHFSNPLFIISTIGISFLHDKKIGFIILLCHSLTNFIIAFVFRPKENKYKYINKHKTSIKTALSKMHYKRLTSKKFGIVLGESINNTINTLLLLLGIITSFLIISTIINNIFNFKSLYKGIISGILEMTQGIKYLSILNISNTIKASLITFIISFGGLSVHSQTISIISDTDIKYKYFFIARIYHAIISSSLVFLILKFMK